MASSIKKGVMVRHFELLRNEGQFYLRLCWRMYQKMIFFLVFGVSFVGNLASKPNLALVDQIIKKSFAINK